MGKRPVKVSFVKQSNKKYSKLLKRGKIKKNDRRLNLGSHVGSLPDHLRKRGKSIAEIDEHHLSEDEVDVTDMLEENDDANIDVMKENLLKRKFNAAEQACKVAERKRKKIADEDEEECHAFERLPRRFESYEETKAMRSVLPIKNKTGIIPQYVEVEETKVDSDTEIAENGNTEEIEDGGVGLSQPKQTGIPKAYFRVDLIERKQKIISVYKLRIAQLASSIVGNPQANMQCLRDLKAMLEDTEPIGFVYRQKLILISLLEVFKDIIPGYKLRSSSEDAKEQRLKKDVKELREFEEGLLKHYKGYLQNLEVATRALSRKKRSDSLDDKSDEKLGEISIKCLCELLITHPHFNFRNNIIVTLVPFATSDNENVSNMCCNALKMLYRHDKIGDASLEAVKQTTKLIKEKSYNVVPKLLDTFLVLKIKDAKFNSEGEKSKKMSHREKQMKMSRREIKRSKQMEKLERELLETAAEESKQKKISFQTEVVKQVFLTYFRILKKAPSSSLLTAVLEGLAKYAHLINVEFFDDLIAVLHNLIDSGTLDYKQCLHCVLTVFTILSGQGEALNIDPYRFYTHLYKSLLSLHVGSSHDDVPIALECLDMMINRRRKKVSFHRVLAFTKRLTTLALQLNHNGVIAALSLVRTFMQNHKRVDILLDTDTSQGSGTFLPELEEPEYCNASTTALWELHFMRSHYHPAVKKLAAHLARGAPIMGDGQLTPNMSRRTPEELYEEFSPTNEDFNPSLDSLSVTQISKTKVKTKQRHWVPVFGQMYQDMVSTLEEIDLTNSFYCNK